MRAEVTKGALQGTSITYNDYFNESSDEGSYVESSEEVAAHTHTHTHTHTFPQKRVCDMEHAPACTCKMLSH